MMGLMALSIALAALASGGLGSCPIGGCGSNAGDWESQARDWMNADDPIASVYPQEGTKTSFVAGAAAVGNSQGNAESPLLPSPTMD